MSAFFGGVLRGALVRKATDQTTADYSTAAAIAWDTETYDRGGWHEGVTNPSRLTVPPGVPRVRASVSVSLAAMTGGADVVLAIYKNGAPDYDGAAAQSVEIDSASPQVNVSSPVLEVVAGDYFEAFLFCSGDNSVTVTAATSSFSIVAV